MKEREREKKKNFSHRIKKKINLYIFLSRPNQGSLDLTRERITWNSIHS